MGLADRDYVRNPQPTRRGGWGGGGFGGGGGGFAPRPHALSATAWLIIINIAVFVVAALLSANGASLAQPVGFGEQVDPATGERTTVVLAQQAEPLFALGHFSTYTAFSKLEVWRFITFQFLHGGQGHLLVNMLALFFFGPAVEQHCGSRRKFLAFYFTCGIFGAFTYLLLNLLGAAGLSLPGVLDYSIFTPLVGASAGVFGTVLATAYIAPNSTILLFFVLPMKMYVGAYAMFGLSLLNLLFGWWNQGGEAAHVGGALAGAYFIRRLSLLDDFFNIFGGNKSPGGARRRSKKQKRKPRASAGGRSAARSLTAAEEKTLDDILERVKKEGMDSLSESEIAFLRSASERKRGG